MSKSYNYYYSKIINMDLQNFRKMAKKFDNSYKVATMIEKLKSNKISLVYGPTEMVIENSSDLKETIYAIYARKNREGLL